MIWRSEVGYIMINFIIRDIGRAISYTWWRVPVLAVGNRKSDMLTFLKMHNYYFSFESHDTKADIHMTQTRAPWKNMFWKIASFLYYRRMKSGVGTRQLAVFPLPACVRLILSGLTYSFVHASLKLKILQSESSSVVLYTRVERGSERFEFKRCNWQIFLSFILFFFVVSVTSRKEAIAARTTVSDDSTTMVY